MAKPPADTPDPTPSAGSPQTADAPAGVGAVAAETVSLAAGLCESLALMAVADWTDARGVAVQAVHLRNRAIAARDANTGAYGRARRQLRQPAGTGTGRDGMLAAALLASVDTLLGIAAAASDTAGLAAEICLNVSPDLRPDALGAAEIATGASAAVTELVAVNLALPGADPRREQAAALLADARTSVERARQALLR